MKIVAQILGLLAIISYAISPHAKTKRRVLVFHLISSILYALQYFLLNAFSAVITNTVGAAKCYIFYLYEKKEKEIPKSLFWIFMLIILALGIFTYNNIYSLIPILASVLSLYSVWQDNLVILDSEETKERQNLVSGDNAEGFYGKYIVVRVRLSDMEKEPASGMRFWIDSNLFMITDVRNEYNELIIGLERYDE